MNHRLTPHRALSALAALALLALPVRTPADEPLRAGFTRPGSPSDTRIGGKVINALDDPETRKAAFGGTVYFMVHERKGAAWDTPLKDFDARFRPGIDFNGTSSPELDRTAKYLYLYQAVNDRHTNSPIESVSVRLLVELKEVTSWGYFHGVGFATTGAAKEDKVNGKIRPVSFSNVVSGMDRLYRQKAPAVPVASPYELVKVPTKQGEQVKDRKDINLVWDALDPANDPNYAMLLSSSDFDKRPAFRAIWSGDNALKRDGRSTVFGFTSNLPPMTEAVRLRGLRLDAKGGVIRPAVAGAEDRPGVGNAQVRADGQVPTPRPERFPTEAASLPPLGALPPMPTTLAPTTPGIGGLSGGGGIPTTGGGGGGGGGLMGTGGGGATGGGSGSAGGTTTAATTAGTTAATTTTSTTSTGSTTTTTTQPSSQTQTVFFNPTLTSTNTNTNSNTNTNRQQQQQQQGQAQLQAQLQQQEQSSQQAPGAVVPGPAGLLLAVLGLPVLCCLRRRKAGS